MTRVFTAECTREHKWRRSFSSKISVSAGFWTPQPCRNCWTLQPDWNLWTLQLGSIYLWNLYSATSR